MADCTICEAYKKKELKILYEDGTIMAYLEEKPAAIGHIKVCTKSHVEKLRNIQDSVASYLFFAASFSAMTVFEQLGAHGTNIIINEGLSKESSHVCIDIIPRKSEDGLTFTWEPKQLSEEDMENALESLKDKAFFIGKERPKQQEPVEIKETIEKKEKKEGEAEDYQIRQIRRIP